MGVLVGAGVDGVLVGVFVGAAVAFGVADAGVDEDPDCEGAFVAAGADVDWLEL